MTLADDIEAYQALLEGHRAYPEDEEILEDLERAQTAMEVAWLEHAVTRGASA